MSLLCCCSTIYHQLAAGNEGCLIGGQSLSSGVEVGKLDIFFDVDHP